MSKYPLLLCSNSGLYSARKGKERFSIFETVDFLAGLGFEAIDVNFAPTIDQTVFGHEPMLDGPDWRERMAKLRSYALSKGLTVPHTHAPFRYRYLDRSDTDHARCEEKMHRSIEATAILGGSHIVVHPVVSADRKTTLIEESVAGLRPLAEYAGNFGVRLAVENMTSTAPETLAEIADRLNADVCWDVGHANFASHASEAAVKFLGSRLRVLHLHDNYGPINANAPSPCDLHQPPFFGNVDWPGLMSGLKAIGYDGPFNYEVASKNVPEDLRAVHGQYLLAAAEKIMGMWG